MMDTNKILEMVAAEESRTKSNARICTVDQARLSMRIRELGYEASGLSFSTDKIQIVPRELFRNTRRRTEK